MFLQCTRVVLRSYTDSNTLEECHPHRGRGIRRAHARNQTCMTIHTHDPGHMHPCQSPHTAGVGDAERGVGDDVGGGGSSGEAAAALPMLLAIIFMP